MTGTICAGPEPMTRSRPGILAGTAAASRLSPDPVCTPIMHEQTSADDQTAAQIAPSRASSERSHHVPSAAMRKAGVCTPVQARADYEAQQGAVHLRRTDRSLPNTCACQQACIVMYLSADCLVRHSWAAPQNIGEIARRTCAACDALLRDADCAPIQLLVTCGDRPLASWTTDHYGGPGDLSWLFPLPAC